MWLTTPQIKNSIIGHQGKKRQYLEAGAVPSVIQVLSETTQDSELVIQAAAALGSFACAGQDSVSAILSHGGLNALLALLSHNRDLPVIRAALRCIKKLYEVSVIHFFSTSLPMWHVCVLLLCMVLANVAAGRFTEST
jgi:hypothetical protein